MPQCENCGAFVTDAFARVFGDQDDVVHRCQSCDTKGRLNQGSAAGIQVDWTVANTQHIQTGGQDA
ncbi:hypothetical protein ACFQH6_20550 [Halobacteriaceae archaeon GCM10025711]